MNTVTTGLTEGDFHRLAMLSNGQMTDILTLLGGGGGSGVTSANTPLSISGSTMSIDLAAYATSSAVNTLLAKYRLTSQLFDGFTVGAGLVAVKSGATLSLGLTGSESRTTLVLADSQGNLRNLSSSLTGTLVWNTQAVALSSDLTNKIDTLTVTAPIAISATGASRAISTLWKPTTVSVGTGLFALASDANGTPNLSLTGTESRTALKIADSNAVVRDLTSTTAGILTWAGASMSTQAYVDNGLATKAEDTTTTAALASLIVTVSAKNANY